MAAAWSGRLGTVMGLMARYPETATEQRLFRTRQLLGMHSHAGGIKLMATIPAREERRRRRRRIYEEGNAKQETRNAKR